MPTDLAYFRRMEVQSRKGAVEAIHPDDCPKLHLHGVDFAIPPRGLQVRPVFDAAGRATLGVDGTDDWPEVDKLIGCVAETMQDDTLSLDLDDSACLLCDLMALARRLLLKQYDFTDEQLAELLSFATNEQPEWINGLLRWCHGMRMDFDVSAQSNEFDPNAIVSEMDKPTAEDNPSPIDAPRRSWWKFW